MPTLYSGNCNGYFGNGKAELTQADGSSIAAGVYAVPNQNDIFDVKFTPTVAGPANVTIVYGDDVVRGFPR